MVIFSKGFLLINLGNWKNESYMLKDNGKQAGNGSIRRHIEDSKIAKGIQSVK